MITASSLGLKSDDFTFFNPFSNTSKSRDTLRDDIIANGRFSGTSCTKCFIDALFCGRWRYRTLILVQRYMPSKTLFTFLGFKRKFLKSLSRTISTFRWNKRCGESGYSGVRRDLMAVSFEKPFFSSFPIIWQPDMNGISPKIRKGNVFPLLRNCAHIYSWLLLFKKERKIALQEERSHKPILTPRIRDSQTCKKRKD